MAEFASVLDACFERRSLELIRGASYLLQRYSKIRKKASFRKKYGAARPPPAASSALRPPAGRNPLLQSLPKDHSGGGIGKIEFPATAHRAATPSGNFDRTPQHGTSQRTRSGEKFQFGLLKPQRAAGRIFHFERQIQTHRTVLTHRHLFSDPDLSDQGLSLIHI